MTKEEAIKLLKIIPVPKGCDDNVHSTPYGYEYAQALDMAIECMKMVEDFENAHIITGGRLNGRAYAYACGLQIGESRLREKVGKAIEEMENIFDDCCTLIDISDMYTVQEVVSRFKEYEENQNDWRDIPAEKMTEAQLKRAVKDLRKENYELRFGRNEGNL